MLKFITALLFAQVLVAAPMPQEGGAPKETWDQKAMHWIAGAADTVLNSNTNVAPVYESGGDFRKRQLFA